MITYDNCKDSVFLCKTINELKEKFPSHYKKIYRNKWTELINHLKTKKPNGYWNNKQNCINAALTCTSRKEFGDKFSNAKKTLLKNGTYNEIVSHIPIKGTPQNFWTKEKCKEISFKYKDLHLFRKEQEYPYSIIIKNKWEDEMLSHMFRKTEKITRVSSYTFEDCKIIAELCSTRSEFLTKYPSHYQRALKKKWLDEISEHMTSSQKPSGYWTKERCHQEALKYNHRADFQKNSGTARNVACQNNWMDEICSHMEYIIKPSGYWTKERCHQEALKYNHRADFQKNSCDAYSASRKRQWLDEICSHMEYIIKPSGYWTKELCRQKALKYSNRKDFVENERGVVSIAHRRGWMDEICTHMEYIYKPNGYWTKEKLKEIVEKYTNLTNFRQENPTINNIIRKNKWEDLYNGLIADRKPFGYWNDKENCRQEALKYKSRTEFSKSHGAAAYSHILKNGWEDELLYHMPFLTNLSKRFIYVFEFDDNFVYVGLTYKIEKRYYDHMSTEKSPVKKHISSNNNFIFKVITDEPLSLIEAQKLEYDTIEKYKNNGWNILNSAKAGGLGGMRIKWTLKECKKLLKQNNVIKLSEVKTLIPSWGLCRLKKEGHYYELIKNLEHDINHPGYWNDKEICKKEALKYNSISSLQKNKSGVYKSIKRNKWEDELFSHMKTKKIIKAKP